MIRSHTEEQFEEAWCDFKLKYAGQQPLLDYLQSEKYPKHHRFIRAFTSKYTHLGHVTTSHAESGHCRFKKWLENNRHDLIDLKDRWSLMQRVFHNDY